MKSDDALGCAGIVGLFAFFGWLAWPSDDQVCRNRKTPIWDNITGASSQPTCQELIDEVDARARSAEEKANDLESRVSELESKLNM